jgi:putative ABC transport system substrate-binding protein
MIGRREFITLFGGAVAGWPVVAEAQQAERMRRIGVLFPYSDDEPEPRLWVSAFIRGLTEFGWTEGRNLRVDFRWAAFSNDRARAFARELVASQPDVILVDSTPLTEALQHETREIPLVFVEVSDPVGSGFVTGLPHPGRNITGFIPWAPTMPGKWIELLVQIAPNIKRVAAIFNPDTAPYVKSNYLPSFEAAARSFGLEPIRAEVHDDAEIESFVTGFGRESAGGLVSLPDAFTASHRTAIMSSAVRNNIPMIFQAAGFARDGALLSYGPNIADMFHLAASYVDRILRGAKPSELPVQFPTKFELAINLKTAKGLGLTVPQTLLTTADEVIE